MEPILLDNLNPKQKSKEFKATIKDLKSKDDDVKIKALEKINKDLRYLNEGSCILPILNSLIPKKVRLDLLFLLVFEC